MRSIEREPSQEYPRSRLETSGTSSPFVWPYILLGNASRSYMRALCSTIFHAPCPPPNWTNSSTGVRLPTMLHVGVKRQVAKANESPTHLLQYPRLSIVALLHHFLEHLGKRGFLAGPPVRLSTAAGGGARAIATAGPIASGIARGSFLLRDRGGSGTPPGDIERSDACTCSNQASDDAFWPASMLGPLNRKMCGTGSRESVLIWVKVFQRGCAQNDITGGRSEDTCCTNCNDIHAKFATSHSLSCSCTGNWQAPQQSQAQQQAERHKSHFQSPTLGPLPFAARFFFPFCLLRLLEISVVASKSLSLSAPPLRVRLPLPFAFPPPLPLPPPRVLLGMSVVPPSSSSSSSDPCLRLALRLPLERPFPPRADFPFLLADGIEVCASPEESSLSEPFRFAPLAVLLPPLLPLPLALMSISVVPLSPSLRSPFFPFFPCSFRLPVRETQSHHSNPSSERRDTEVNERRGSRGACICGQQKDLDG